MKVKIKYSEDYPKEWGPPQYETEGAVAFDLRSLDGCGYSRYGSGVYRTGLHFEIPEGYGLFIFSRSGHGFKYDVRLANCVGVIDSDYRGEVKVKLAFDHGQSFCVQKGDRIAQGVIMPIVKAEFEVVEDGLSPTIRGEKGFGSTGQ